MTTSTILNKGFTYLLDQASETARIRYYESTAGSVWDDEVTLAEIPAVILAGSGANFGPNLTGSYIESGTYGGKSLYVNSSGTAVLWFNNGSQVYTLTSFVGGFLERFERSGGDSTLTAGSYYGFGGGIGSIVGTNPTNAAKWVSGIIQPLDTTEGSKESVLVQQGKLIDGDKKLYVNGSVTFNGSIFKTDVMIGSPTGDLYTTIPDGGIGWSVHSTPIYTKQYIRRLTGSTL